MQPKKVQRDRRKREERDIQRHRCCSISSSFQKDCEELQSASVSPTHPLQINIRPIGGETFWPMLVSGRNQEVDVGPKQ